jgi:hypothetical protein
MREYSTKISLVRNSREVYILDTSLGCASGTQENARGCYGDCYAAKSAKLYGYDFSKTVLRDFENEYHRRRVMNQINRAKLDFIRIGGSGDPSENWPHTIKILKQIDKCNKEIVIITKHWTLFPDDALPYLRTINVCFNTSISALDSAEQLEKSLRQYERIRPYCKSILRVVSCDFNLDNSEGRRLAQIQYDLFKRETVLDTVFRPSKQNPLVTSGVINTSTAFFMGKKTMVSQRSRKTFTGKCSKCKEMCGVDMETGYDYFDKPGTFKQLKLFAQ